MNRAALKSQAKEQIRGKIGILFLITLIIGAISFAASLILAFIPGGGIISSIFITPAFTISILRVYLNLTKAVEPKAGDSFSGFDDFWAAFKVTFLVGLFTFLWSLLFVIPGIIKSYSYRFAAYILAENKGKAALQCIDESKKMTEGHKMDLFVLDLSFIGWALLGSITCGIAYIWVLPYMQATYANTYNSLKPAAAAQTVAETPAPAIEIPVIEAPVVETPATEAPATEE